MGITPETQKLTKMFTFSNEHFEPLMNQLLSEFANSANKRGGCCQTAEKSSKWCSCINLSSIPTKAEELHVKVDEKSRTLTVSGKSNGDYSTRRIEDLLNARLDKRNSNSRGCGAEDDRVKVAGESAHFRRPTSAERRRQAT